MAKQITRVVLTGGPAAGKTTLISRILKEFNHDSGWRVITIPETATELISGFGLGPFPGCMTMEQFQYFVVGDQLHKEQLALKGAETVPEEKILIIYDRAVFDDLAYINMEHFIEVLDSFGKTPEKVMEGYDAVLHLVTCAKGAEYAYNFGNAARYESVEEARALDDRTIRAWSSHPRHYIIDNSDDFDAKISRAINRIYQVIGQEVPQVGKRKLLVRKPDIALLTEKYGATRIEMTQTYLAATKLNTERRVRKQMHGKGYLYFYTEKKSMADGTKWVTEKPISEKTYSDYLLEADSALSPVHKEKYRFEHNGHRMEIDLYPFCSEKAMLFVYGQEPEKVVLPEEIIVLDDVTGNPEYKNKRLAEKQAL